MNAALREIREFFEARTISFNRLRTLMMDFRLLNQTLNKTLHEGISIIIKYCRNRFCVIPTYLWEPRDSNFSSGFKVDPPMSLIRSCLLWGFLIPQYRSKMYRAHIPCHQTPKIPPQYRLVARDVGLFLPASEPYITPTWHRARHEHRWSVLSPRPSRPLSIRSRDF